LDSRDTVSDFITRDVETKIKDVRFRICNTSKVMTKPELSTRNNELAIDVLTTINLLTTIELLPDNSVQDELVRQLIRCSISIGTNYETASSTKSTRNFINKLKKQKIDNSKSKEKLNVLLTEANQLLSIYAPSKNKRK
jgi:23S rRNA-intervening sequence protein